MSRLVSELGADVIDDTPKKPRKIDPRKRNYVIGISATVIGAILIGLVYFFASTKWLTDYQNMNYITYGVNAKPDEDGPYKGQITASIISVDYKSNYPKNFLIPQKINGHVITKIENEAFAGCKRLESVTMQNNILSIGSEVFINCTNLKDIKFSKNLSYIGNDAFLGTQYQKSWSEHDYVLANDILIYVNEDKILSNHSASSLALVSSSKSTHINDYPGSLVFSLTSFAPVDPASEDKQVAGSPIFSEIGSSGLRQSGGYIYEEFLKRLQWPYAGAIYQEMSSNDPVITAVLFCCRMLLRDVTWKVLPNSDSDADIECAEFVESCMNDMSETWADFVDEMMSYFTYGFSLHEIVYKKRNGPNKNGSKNSQYNDGRIGWRKLPGRRQTTLCNWEFDSAGGIKGVWQLADGKRIFLPIEKCLLFKTGNYNGNPEGTSFLRGAYRPWYFKKHIEEIEGIGIERDLAGLPVIITPEGLDIDNKQDPAAAEARNRAIQLVTSIRRDRNDGVVLSNGWELKLLSTGGTRQFDTNAIINRYDQRIAITLLADIIML